MTVLNLFPLPKIFLVPPLASALSALENSNVFGVD